MSDSPRRGSGTRRTGPAREPGSTRLIYTSHISERRKQRDLANLSDPPARANKSAELAELEKLRKRNEQLEEPSRERADN